MMNKNIKLVAVVSFIAAFVLLTLANLLNFKIVDNSPETFLMERNHEHATLSVILFVAGLISLLIFVITFFRIVFKR